MKRIPSSIGIEAIENNSEVVDDSELNNLIENLDVIKEEILCENRESKPKPDPINCD